jgi:hypothetical protein
LPSTHIGQSGAVAFEIQAFLHRNQPGVKNSLVSYRKDRSDSSADIELYLVGNNVNIRLGTEVVSSSYSAPIVNTWTYIAVNIANGANGRASAQLFVNGVDFTGTLTNAGAFNGALASVRREYNFLGYSNYAGSVASFRGMVDSFAVWGKALTLQTVQSHAALAGQDPAFVADGLIVRFDFPETTGTTTRGRIGTAAQESQVATLDYPRAVLAGGDFTGWQRCNGWGDPHWTDLYGKAFDTIHTEGYFNNLECQTASGKSAFVVSTWHMTGCCWGGATVIRAVNIRMGDTIVQYAASQAQSNGIAGPWVYKVVPAGISAANVAWISFTPIAGVPLTVGSGLVVDVRTGGSTPDFYIFGAPFGYVHLTDSANYANMDIWVNQGSCQHSGVQQAVCNGGVRPVPSWIFTGEPITPTPLADPPPVAAPPPQVCEPALVSVSEKNCKRCFPLWATPNSQGGQATQFEQCKGDICATGNPYCPPPPCEVGKPCCKCAATGTCVIDGSNNSTSCTCDEGYGGADCSQVLSLVSLTLTTPTTMYDSLPYVITPHDLAEAIDTQSVPTGSALALANPWKVKNSLLVYVATASHLGSNGVVTHSQHLYAVHDATSFSAGLAHTIALEYTGLGGYTGTPAVIGNGASLPGGSLPATATLNTQPTSPSGFVFPNLPAGPWCVKFTTNGQFGANQVVVGSGNIRGQLDVIRVVEANQGFSICGQAKTNPCADLMNCADCTASSECGWCRTTGTCRYGRPNGPTDGTMCPAWAFTFDTKTRRITESYGYPVSPVDTTIVLGSSAADTLPIELKIDMAYRFYSAWDVQVMFPRGPSNQAELTNMQGSIQNVADFLRANYLNSALSVAAYSSRESDNAPADPTKGDVGVYKQIFPLVAPSDPATLQGLMNAISIQTTALGDRVHLSLALSRAGATQQPGWRTNARHMVIVFATHPDINTAANIAQTRRDLLAFSVLPVFVVTPSVKAFYQQYVADLGFGLIIDYTNPASMPQLIDRAMADASVSITVTPDENHPGRIDFDAGKLDDVNSRTLTLTGLAQKMRARIALPVSPKGNDDYAVILAPGFGKATIQAIASDSPYTNGVPVKVEVDSPLDPYTTETGTLVYLTGKPADVLNSNAIVQAYVRSLTAGRGKLYQFNEAALRVPGALVSSLVEITPLDDTVDHQVTDVQGRVIYVPPNDEFGPAADVAYATIKYRVKDECSYSPYGTVPVFVTYENNESPTTSHAAVNTNENQAVVIDFTGTDSRAHELKVVITKLPTNAAGNALLNGKLYAYSDACRAALAANFKDVSACGAELIVGSEIVPTTHSADGNRWTSTVRAIYVPFEYANSAGIPAVYKTTPNMEYKFVQLRSVNDVGTFVALETAPVSFDIVIAPVNQKPYAAYKPVFETWLSWPSSYTVPDPSTCTTVDNEAATGNQCVYEQNFGIPYPNLAAPETLVLFGADVDNAQLSLVVTSVNCAADAQLEAIDTAQRLVPGLVINTQPFQANGWAGIVRFLPTQDGSGNPYCRFSYRVTDGELTSDDENTVEIQITFEAQPPRSESYRVFAPTIEATPFEFSARTVNDHIGNAIQSIYIKSVTVKSCSGDATSTLEIAGTTINCGALPAVINVADNNADIDVGAGKQHTFGGSWTPTALSVNGFSVVVSYHDTHEPSLESMDYLLTFSYRQVNQGPQLQFIDNSQSDETWSTDITRRVAIKQEQGLGEASIGFNVRDKDVGEGNMVVRVEGYGIEDVATINFVTSNAWARDETGWTFSAPLAAVVQELAGLSVSVAGNKAQFNVSIVVHDNGHTGACTPEDVNSCDKIAKAFVIVTATSAANAVAIGLAAGAGGAALAAAAAAAIAWRALREPPTESYNPWEMDDAVEGTVMNPLFEASGNSGDNPMFEGASKP